MKLETGHVKGQTAPEIPSDSQPDTQPDTQPEPTTDPAAEGLPGGGKVNQTDLAELKRALVEDELQNPDSAGWISGKDGALDDIWSHVTLNPSLWDLASDEAKERLARVAWGVYDTCDNKAAGADSEDYMKVLALAWGSPVSRLVIQKGMGDALWDKGRKAGLAALLEQEAEKQKGNSLGGDFAPLLSDVVAKRRRWLVEPWIAQGRLHSLEGKKGAGKSQLLLWIAGQFFRRHPDGTVLYFTFEDNAAEDIKPRAIAQGIDQSRLVVIPEPLTFEDVPRIREYIIRYRAKLVFFDTLQKYVHNPNSDMNSTFGAQGQLKSVEAMAHEMDVAVVVTRHHRKGRVADASEAGSGSAGIAGAMRAVLTCGRMENDEFGLALSVGNHSKRGGGIIYTLEGAMVPTSDGMAETCKLRVLREDASLDADDLTSGGGGGKEPTEAEEAEAWLRENYATAAVVDSAAFMKVCRDEDSLFQYKTLKRVLAKCGWKAGKAPDETGGGAVGVHKGVWTAPEGWTMGGFLAPVEPPPKIENELLDKPLENGTPSESLSRSSAPRKNNDLDISTDDSQNFWTLTRECPEVPKTPKTPEKVSVEIENEGCPRHGRSAMPRLKCLVENCDHDERRVEP